MPTARRLWSPTTTAPGRTTTPPSPTTARGRLTESTLGSVAVEQFAFTFRYDALQNMTFRTASPGRRTSVCSSAPYRYGERGYGPRQLTSVVPGGTP